MSRLRRELRERLRRELDAWFGTIARYVGLVLIVYSLLVDRLRNPGLLPLATGLVFMKNVVGKGE